MPFAPRPTEYQDPWFNARETYDQSLEAEINLRSLATHQHAGSGVDSIRLGNSASSTGSGSVAVGAFTVANNPGSTAIGVASEARTYSSIAIGNGRIAGGGGAVAIGGNALGDYSTAVGESSQIDITGIRAVTVGNESSAHGANSTVIGHEASVPSTSPRSVAIGQGAFPGANTPDRGVIRVNDLEVVRSDGVAGASTLRLHSPDNTIGVVAVTDTDELVIGTKNQVARANHTGTQSADTLTDGTTNKAFLATERTKLAGIATAATANSPDATLLARGNHTGTQLAATISDFATTQAANLAGATAKITPVDADTLPLTDSAASGALKKLSWLNVKAALNALYAPLAHQHAGSGSSSIALGSGVTASTFGAIGIGSFAEVTGAGATAIGVSKTAYGDRAVSIGGYADAPDSVAIGDSSDIAVAATEAISIGSGSFVDAVSGIAVGGGAQVPSTSPRSIALGKSAAIPASTPDRGVIRVNELQVQRSNGSGATTLRLASPDGTAGVIAVTDADGITVNGSVPSPVTPLLDPTMVPLQLSDNWTVSAAHLGRGAVSQSDAFDVPTTQIALVDFFVPYSFDIDGFAINVGTLAVGGLIRLGLFSLSSDGLTSTLIYDASTVGTDTTGSKSVLFTPITVTRGWYQYGVIRSTAETAMRIRGFVPAMPVYAGYNGGGLIFNITSSGGYRAATHAGGAATPFAASYNPINSNILVPSAPAVFMRVQR